MVHDKGFEGGGKNRGNDNDRTPILDAQSPTFEIPPRKKALEAASQLTEGSRFP